MKVRRFAVDDTDEVRGLASRLTAGVAPWRDQAAVLASVCGWVDASLAGHDDEHPIFVAQTCGRVVGFAAAGRRKHWAGDTDAYIGELAVAAGHRTRGIGRALVAAVEAWARDSGYTRVTLETGARNDAARAFYAKLGYIDEEVVLTRLLN